MENRFRPLIDRLAALEFPDAGEVAGQILFRPPATPAELASIERRLGAPEPHPQMSGDTRRLWRT